MVGPAARIGLYSLENPGGFRPAAEAEGHHQTAGRPALSSAQRQGDHGEQVAVIEGNLSFGDLDPEVGTGGGHMLPQRLVEGEGLRHGVEKQQLLGLHGERLLWGCFVPV